MNAAGIDVSSRKSTVAILRPFGEVVKLPFDVRHSAEDLVALAVAFAGIDPAPNESGDYSSRSNKTTKRGSPYLRKTLFNIMTVHLQHAPPDEPVFQFLDKKRSEGKPYYVYMTAAGNKFCTVTTVR